MHVVSAQWGEQVERRNAERSVKLKMWACSAMSRQRGSRRRHIVNICWRHLLAVISYRWSAVELEEGWKCVAIMRAGAEELTDTLDVLFWMRMDRLPNQRHQLHHVCAVTRTSTVTFQQYRMWEQIRITWWGGLQYSVQLTHAQSKKRIFVVEEGGPWLTICRGQNLKEGFPCWGSFRLDTHGVKK